MTCPPARTGRHRQRYQDQFRLVAGCIPYKFEKGGGDQFSCRCHLERRLRVLMISTPKHHDLVFPKGGWEDDEDITDAACREALEEAGVKGRLSDEPLGIWEFRSKSRENSCSQGGGCRGHMYAMEVTQELDSWPEQATYVRKWLTVDEAFELCRYDWMRDALKRLLTLLSKDETDERMGDTTVEFHKPLFPRFDHNHQNLLSPVCFGKPSDNLCLNKTHSRSCLFGLTYFLGIFTIFRTLSCLERKVGAQKRKPNGL